MRLTSFMRFRVGSFWGAFLVGWLCLVRLAAAPSFTAEITPPAVGAGDNALLRLIFTDLGDVTPEAAQAAITGKPPADLGEHGELRLR